MTSDQDQDQDQVTGDRPEADHYPAQGGVLLHGATTSRDSLLYSEMVTHGDTTSRDSLLYSERVTQLCKQSTAKLFLYVRR